MNCDGQRWDWIGLRTGKDLSQFSCQTLQRPETIVLKGPTWIAIATLSREPSRGGGRGEGGMEEEEWRRRFMAHTWTVNNECSLPAMPLSSSSVSRIGFHLHLQSAYSLLTGEERTLFRVSRLHLDTDPFFFLRCVFLKMLMVTYHKICFGKCMDRPGASQGFFLRTISLKKKKMNWEYDSKMALRFRRLNNEYGYACHSVSWQINMAYSARVVCGETLTGWIAISCNCHFDKLAYASLSFGQYRSKAWQETLRV